MDALDELPLDELDAEQALQVSLAAEKIAARAQAIQLRAVARFAQLRRRGEGDSSWAPNLSRHAPDELGLALSVSRRAAGQRVALAYGLTARLPETWAALHAGRIDAGKARVIADRTGQLEDDQAHAVELCVLPRAEHQTHPELKAATDRAAIKIDPKAAAKRRTEQIEQREVRLHPLDDGVSELVARLPAEVAAASYDRLCELAAKAKTPEDTRTPDQLRADVFADLLLGNTTGGSTQAQILILTRETSLLRLDDEPGELIGSGPLPAEVVREIAEQHPNSIWRRLLTDPTSGVVTDLGRTRYRPTAGPDEFVRMRVQLCYFPGCRKPATRCDLDHVQAVSQGGGTSERNLGPVCSTTTRSRTALTPGRSANPHPVSTRSPPPPAAPTANNPTHSSGRQNKATIRRPSEPARSTRDNEGARPVSVHGSAGGCHHGAMPEQPSELITELALVSSVAELARVLRQLRRREARLRGGPELSYRQLAAKTGWAHGAIGEYLSGKTLAPTDRFDALVRLLGATVAEQRALATVRDLVADRRRERQPAGKADWVTVRPLTPQELPPDVFGFTGRADQLAALDGLLAASTQTSTMGIALVAGTAGVGKTALAVHWAHQVEERFPDGQLYLDLRGYGPGRPVSATQAIGGLLRGLGVAGADLPGDLERRTARYRSLLSGRRVLVLLDNAYSADQVRPLLPGGPPCFVVVTSRDDLPGLVARDGARRVEVEPLPRAEAVALLGTLVGPRVQVEPAAAGALAERCARLPLALRVAAELVAVRKEEPLAALVAELADERQLDVLDSAEDARAGVRSTFSWSLRHLPAEATAAFRVLGLHHGQDFDGYALAALIGTDVGDAQRRLDRLERAHLVQRRRPGRYQLHDLLRAYAREQAQPDPAALTRLFDHYLHTAVRAMDTLFPHERDRRPSVPSLRPDRSGVPEVPDVAEPGRATDWVEAERANLAAMSAYTARYGWRQHCTDLSRTLWRYLDVHGHYQDGLALHADSAMAALPGSNERAEALTHLGMARWRLGDCANALALLAEALTIHRAVGRPTDQARVLANLAIIYETVGRYDESFEHHQQALRIYQDIGDRHREARTLGNLGALHCRLGDHARAIEHQQQSAVIGRALGDAHAEGYALGNLGHAYQQLGRYREALASQLPALTTSRALGDRRGEAEMLRSIGVTYARLERFEDALGHLDQALTIARELGNPSQEGETLNDLGEAQRATHRPAAALASHTRAHAIATEVGNPHEQARALDGMADALHLLGRFAEAHDHWRRALAGYTDLGLPEAARVRVRLDGLRETAESPQWR